MSLPPERISIKRRRGDEPIETLVLERDRKRRFTDFIFQRLPNQQADFAPRFHQHAADTKKIEGSQEVNARQGIPVVKATQPGEESTDLSKFRAAQRVNHVKNEAGNSISTDPIAQTGLQPKPHTEATSLTRRFHLTRALSSNLKHNTAGDIRKSKWTIRPPLPTFVERQRVANDQEKILQETAPIDRILDSSDQKPLKVHRNSSIGLDPATLSKTQIPTFISPKTSRTRTGRSIRDDPHTWDLDSDQLADELAALAMEMDPAADNEQMSDIQTIMSPPVADHHHISETVSLTDEFVYETYVRMQLDSSGVAKSLQAQLDFGFLVIDEEDEDLWEQYVRDEDDDDEWDEEDEDSNVEDNPRNDYPEDEVSSDDDYGRNVYKHRAIASDEEEYGDD